MPIDSPEATSDRDAVIMAPLGTDQKLRIGAYTLAASLLRSAPDQTMLDYLIDAGRDTDGRDDIAIAMAAMAEAAATTTPAKAGDEFHDLFIGVGRGELVPFGSWYLTGFLMEKPLSLLRTDLAQLGFERQPAVSEPEDHAAALAEVMAMLISDAAEHDTQQQFYDKHLSSWMLRFFTDLQQSASFYRTVGQFGVAFIKLENRYFSMQL